MDTNLSKLWETEKDRGAWSTAVHGVAKNQTWLSDFHFRTVVLEKALESPLVSKVIKPVNPKGIL